MFEEYTEDARRSIFYARTEALKRDAALITPEHLLLGMLRAEPDMIHRLSPSQGSSVDDLQREIKAALPPENKSFKSKELPLSAETKNALHAAYEASEAMRHRHIGVEHLLLGLFGEEQRYGESSESKINVRYFLSERGFDKHMIEEKIRSDAAGA